METDTKKDAWSKLLKDIINAIIAFLTAYFVSSCVSACKGNSAQEEKDLKLPDYEVLHAT